MNIAYEYDSNSDDFSLMEMSSLLYLRHFQSTTNLVHINCPDSTLAPNLLASIDYDKVKPFLRSFSIQLIPPSLTQYFS